MHEFALVVALISVIIYHELRTGTTVVLYHIVLCIVLVQVTRLHWYCLSI